MPNQNDTFVAGGTTNQDFTPIKDIAMLAVDKVIHPSEGKSKFDHLIPEHLEEDYKIALGVELERILSGQDPTAFQEDPGILAREKLLKNLERFQKRRKRFYSFLFVFILLLGAVGYWVYSQVETLYDRHYRTCSVKLEDQEDFFVTGQRMYDYSYKSLFSFRIMDNNDMHQKTHMDINGQAMTIIGLAQNGTAWWRLNIGQGEKDKDRKSVV